MVWGNSIFNSIYLREIIDPVLWMLQCGFRVFKASQGKHAILLDFLAELYYPQKP